MKRYWFRAVLALVLSIPAGSLDASIAYIIRYYTDDYLFADKTAGLGAMHSPWFFPFLIVALAFFQSLMEHLSKYLNTWVAQRMSMDAKMALYQKLLRREPSFYDKVSSGDVIFLYNNDVDLGFAGLLGTIKNSVTRLVTSISLIGVMFWNSWILALVAVTLMGVAVYPLTQVRKKLRHLFNKTVFVGSALFTNYNETFTGNRVIASYNLFDYMTNKMRHVLKGHFNIGIKLTQRAGTLGIFMHTVTAVGIALVVWLQGYLIERDMLTPGQFVSFILAMIMLYTPIKKMNGMINSISLSLMALERIKLILDTKPVIRSKDNALEIKSFRHAITYENVTFEYEPGKPVLKGVNLEVKAGESVAFVGNSGGGKTTLVNLLPRFYEAQEGRIAIDDIDVKDIDLVSLRNLIAIVFQDNFLFAGTIRQNILLGKGEVSDEEIAWAVKAACLDDFVQSLEHGLDTEIGERGILLSGGQKQRIAIARAFIKQSPIVILDEATSALDNKSEGVVQEAIENLMEDRTVFIIAHRLTTVINADKIVVVNNGVIAEVGSHEKLIAKNGIYAGLYKNQIF